jgi:cyclopropane fatty-acyl-phospholipid synthase-like methyltransferase
MSSKQNDETIKVYNEDLESYIKGTPQEYQENHGPLLKWINATLSMLSKGGRILEIGSGTGREAHYISSKGFDITLSDGAQSFVSYLKSQGDDALLINAVDDPIPTGYEMIFANAVVSHFTPEDLQLVLKKIFDALPQGGLVAFSTKQGKGEKWVNEKFHEKRYIHLWTVDEIKKLVEDAGFSIIFIEHDIPGDLKSHTWINLTAKK